MKLKRSRYLLSGLATKTSEQLRADMAKKLDGALVSTKPKFCVDCKFYLCIPGSYGGKKDQHFCEKPSLLNVVTGSPSNPASNRNNANLCGPDAKYFIPREKRHG